VENAQRDDGDLAGRYFDVFELGEIERVAAAELDPHFLAAQRASVKKAARLREVNEGFATTA
jgi:hypothetical protein